MPASRRRYSPGSRSREVDDLLCVLTSKPTPAAAGRTGLFYCTALLCEVAVFHRRVLFQRGFLFPWDFRGVHLPLASLVSAAFRRGELPLWDPYTYCGNPVFANIQSALFYPPASAAALAAAWFGPDSLGRFLVWAVVAQVFFAGVCTFALLRRLGAQPAAAWAGATVYELGCFFASQAEHMGAMGGASWLPLVWWSVIELRDPDRGRRRSLWLAILSLALSMTVFAGLPQIAVAAFGSALALAVVLALFRMGPAALPIRVLLGWVWALLIAAVQMVPTWQLTMNSVAKYRADWLGSGGGIKLGALFSLVVPNYWSVFDLSKFHGPSDPTFLYLYSSIAGLVLALAAMVWKPDRWSRAFAVFLVAATIWMLGDSTPIGRAIFLALPVNIRIGIHPEFTIAVFALGIAVLAGLGADRFLPPRLQLAAGLIIALDLLVVGSGRPFDVSSLTAEPGIAYDSIDGSRDLSARLHTLSGAADPPYRVDMADAPFTWSSSAPLMGIPTANGCDPLAPERTIQLRLSFAPGERWGTCYQVVNPSSLVIGLANVRYLVSRSPVAGPVFHQVAGAAGYTIYENTRTLPRFFFAAAIQPVDGLAQAARILHSPDFDPSRTAIVEASAGELPSGGLASGQVDVISYRDSAIELRTQSSGTSFLIVADSWYPGWEAAIDGRPSRLFPTDAAFRGILVPAGEHHVAMQFVPRILYLPAMVSLLAFLAAVGSLFWRVRAGKSAPAA